MSGQRPMAVTWVQPPSPPGPRTSGSTCVEWGKAVCTGHCEAPGIKNRTMQTVEGGAREVGLLLSWGRGREVGLNELGDSLLRPRNWRENYMIHTHWHTYTPSGTFTHTRSQVQMHTHTVLHTVSHALVLTHPHMYPYRYHMCKLIHKHPYTPIHAP